MILSQDPFMKAQQVNMMLRANNMDLETFCLSANIDMIKLQYDLGKAGFSYNPQTRKFE